MKRHRVARILRPRGGSTQFPLERVGNERLRRSWSGPRSDGVRPPPWSALSAIRGGVRHPVIIQLAG
jgi:hypothetical protein